MGGESPGTERMLCKDLPHGLSTVWDDTAEMQRKENTGVGREEWAISLEQQFPIFLHWLSAQPHPHEHTCPHAHTLTLAPRLLASGLL